MAGAIDSNCAAWSVTGRSEGYHGEVFTAQACLNTLRKIGIYKLPYRDAIIIQNPSSYQVDERGYCKDLAEESGHDPYP